jgi:hypothetical protein
VVGVSRASPVRHAEAEVARGNIGPLDGDASHKTSFDPASGMPGSASPIGAIGCGDRAGLDDRGATIRRQDINLFLI